ncbi:MAG: GNAT family N-acetyltransferase [Desulfomonilaceae bacterium]
MTSLDRISRVDKTGCPFEVGKCNPESSSEIKKMYDGFPRLAISQGLPPAQKEVRDRWIEKLLEFGRNFLAWSEGNAVGHAAVIPDFDRGDGEYVIFVSAPFRNRGFGTALTELAIDDAKTIGLRRLWLTVEAFNFRAIRLYRNAGFTALDHGERELTMIMRL